MSDRNSGNNKIVPGILALIAAAATVVAGVMVLPKVAWGPALICALVAGLLLEGASFSVSAMGYYSLATALYFLILMSDSVPGEGTEKMLLSLGLGVSAAGICSVGRFFAPGSDHHTYSMNTRLAGYGLTVIRVALVGGVILGAERAGLGILVGAGAGYGLWLALDASLVGGVLSVSEETETTQFWERAPFTAKAVMALAPLVGIAGSGLVVGEVQHSVLAVIGVALVGLAFRNTAQYYIDEIVVGDQRQMEVSLNQARAQKRSKTSRTRSRISKCSRTPRWWTESCKTKSARCSVDSPSASASISKRPLRCSKTCTAKARALCRRCPRAQKSSSICSGTWFDWS